MDLHLDRVHIPLVIIIIIIIMKNVTFLGVKTYSDPPIYFRGQDPNTSGSTRLLSVLNIKDYVIVAVLCTTCTAVLDVSSNVLLPIPVLN